MEVISEGPTRKFLSAITDLVEAQPVITRHRDTGWLVFIKPRISLRLRQGPSVLPYLANTQYCLKTSPTKELGNYQTSINPPNLSFGRYEDVEVCKIILSGTEEQTPDTGSAPRNVPVKRAEITQ